MPITTMLKKKRRITTNDFPVDMDLVKTVDFSKPDTEKAMEELMQLKEPPTAIFTFKNYITLDAIAFLKKRYPEKLDYIEFTDFGNLSLFKYLDHKPLASIEENFYEVGRQAAILLFKMMNEENQNQEEKTKIVEIPCKLIIHPRNISFYLQ